MHENRFILFRYTGEVDLDNTDLREVEFWDGSEWSCWRHEAKRYKSREIADRVICKLVTAGSSCCKIVET